MKGLAADQQSSSLNDCTLSTCQSATSPSLSPSPKKYYSKESNRKKCRKYFLKRQASAKPLPTIQVRRQVIQAKLKDRELGNQILQNETKQQAMLNQQQKDQRVLREKQSKQDTQRTKAKQRLRKAVKQFQSSVAKMTHKFEHLIERRTFEQFDSTPDRVKLDGKVKTLLTKSTQLLMDTNSAKDKHRAMLKDWKGA